MSPFVRMLAVLLHSWREDSDQGEHRRQTDPILGKIESAAPSPGGSRRPKAYVSYAWAQEQLQTLVAELCAALEGQGVCIVRDSTILQPGERISHYMAHLSAGHCVVVVLSKAYLRSVPCMTELYRLYTNARQRDDEFLRRIVPLVQQDARISSPYERIAHALYWKRQHDDLDALVREHGPAIIGEADLRCLKLMGEFYCHVGDMLFYVNDVLVPRDRPTLSHDGFAMVRKLIERALEGKPKP